MEMQVRWMFVLFILVLSSAIFQVQFVRAGSFSVLPSTVFGTAVSFSASYPEFRFEELANISLTVSVTFNNASVSAVNVTAIHIRLYSLDVNLNQIAKQWYPSAPLGGSYAYANWLSTDYYGSFPYHSSTPRPIKIQSPSPEVTSNTWSFDNLTLDFRDQRGNEVEAKLYIQVTFICLDRNGEPLWSNSGGNYHWVLFSSEGEAPIVTIHPKSVQFWSRPETLAIIFSSIGLVLVIIGVVSIRRRKTPTQPPIPPPPEARPKRALIITRI